MIIPYYVPVHMRWMLRRDMSEVTAIDHACYKDPWTEEDYLRRLRERKTIGMVAERTETNVAGFVVYSLHKYYLTIDSLGVDPRYQDVGVGKQLIQKIINKLSPSRRMMIEFVPREWSYHLYQFMISGCGFEISVPGLSEKDQQLLTELPIAQQYDYLQDHPVIQFDPTRPNQLKFHYWLSDEARYACQRLEQEREQEREQDRHYHDMEPLG